MKQLDLSEPKWDFGTAYTAFADISPCGRYRYQLGRRWGEGPPLGFVMLNPSTADGLVDDPTIRRCIGFARRDGYAGIIVTNLFAWRATDPRELRAVADPVGPECNKYIKAMPEDVVIAWGATRPRPDTASRIISTCSLLYGRRIYHLGRTKDGSCRHPLYVRADQPLERAWEPA